MKSEFPQVTSNLQVVLSIAGFDPSGGAGIITDVSTIVRSGCRPAAAITSLTFQNASGVFGSTHETAKSLRAQVLPIIEETNIAAVKIGMLPTAELVSEVVCLIQEKRLPTPVFDPVLRSSSGYELMERDAVEVLKRDLLPLVRVITPNIPEAAALSGIEIVDEPGMREAAKKLRELGARAVLIKGGHLKKESGVRSQESAAESQAIDVLDEDGVITVFRERWIEAGPVRGTGCMLSSAIAAGLAKGNSLPEAVTAAKQFVFAEIKNSELRAQT
jgi:hydroxymethylpyrimidine/phosphomethylpyrimidine kinase